MSKLLVSTQDFSQLTQIADQLMEAGDAIPESLEIAITEALTTQAQTVTRYCQFLNMADQEIEAVEREIKLAQDWIAEKRKRQEKMLNLVAYIMRKTKLRRLDGNHGHKFSLRKSESVRVDFLTELLPDQFIKTEVKKSPDKKAIKDALKSGIEVPGCIIEERDNLNWS